MLKRIALLSDDEKAYRTLTKKVHGMDVSLIQVAIGDALPPGTSGVIATGGLAKSLDAALALGKQGEEIFLLLAEAIGCRESFVPGSAERVRDHATRFAQALGLDTEDRIALERSALVRDIGKLKVPNNILLKDGALSYEDWNLLQRHTHIGADLVKETDSLRDTEAIVRCHHESYDGDGYPERLEGEAIPYLARVLKIVDVFCAMTSPRIYRAGQATRDEALEHLRNERDKHFDPELLDVFLNEGIGQERV